MIIEQKPLYKTLPVGQDIIFTVSDNTIVANNFNVKFTAQVFVADDSSGVFSTQSLVATLKVTPNNAGVGIFSLEPILESYVSPQYQGTDFGGVIFSTYKGTAYSDDNPHPIHLIDKYSNNVNNTKYFGISFNIQYFTSATSTTPVSFNKPILSNQYLIFVGKSCVGFSATKDVSVWFVILNNVALSFTPSTFKVKVSFIETILNISLKIVSLFFKVIPNPVKLVFQIS